MVVWAALAAAFATSAIALEPNMTAYFSITAMSPLLQLEPQGAWVDTYSNFDDSSYLSGSMGSGVPMLSAGPGARASFQYTGMNMTWIALPTGVDQTSVSAQVDGTAQPGPYQETVNSGLRWFWWASNPDIPFGAHTASIGLVDAAPPEARLSVWGGLSGTRIVARGTSVNETRCYSWSFFRSLAPGVISKWLIVNGPWQRFPGAGGTGGQPLVPAYGIAANRTSSVTIQLPPSTTLFMLNGTVGPAFGLYTVQVNPPPPIPLNMTFNSNRRYLTVNQTFSIIALDPEVEYTVTVTGDQDPAKFLGLSEWKTCFLQDPQFLIDELGLDNSSSSNETVGTIGNANASNTTEQDISSNNTSQNSAGDTNKTNVGAIVGGVVGGVVGSALLAVLVFLLCRRRKNQKEDNQEPFVIDATDDAITPYPRNEAGYSQIPQTDAAHQQGSAQQLHSMSTTSGNYPVQYNATGMQEKPIHFQGVDIPPHEPMREETIQALLAALQKQQSHGGGQEEDAGPINTVPPSYNPGWQPPQPESPIGVPSSERPPLPPRSKETSPPMPRSKW